MINYFNKKEKNLETEIDEIVIKGVTYVPKETKKTESEKFEGMEYVIVRTYSAGVFAGYLKTRTGMEAVLVNARRIWYWAGANSLSDLATQGTKKPDECKFTCEVAKTELTQVIEILSVTQEAKKNIAKVKIWQQ